METLLSCNLCQSARFATYAMKRGASTGQLFRITRCCECGLLFVNPRLTKTENRDLYNEAYFNGYGFDAAINYVALERHDETARAGENAGIIDKIRTLKPRLDCSVLDVGCGTGSLLRALVHAGYGNTTGLEFSEYAASVALASGARVIVGDVLDGVLGDERFDVINATEVIEHLRDPMTFFLYIKKLLQPDGVFVYSTGNASSAYARSMGAHWPYINPEGHLFYYSPRTIAQYFQAVGLQTLRLDFLESDQRRRLVRAEERIAHAQLRYFGKTASGLKGMAFRTVAAMPDLLTRRAIVNFHGRLRLPIAINRA